MAMRVVDPWTGTVGCVSDDVFAGGWEQVQERLEHRCECCVQSSRLEITADLVERAWKDLESWFGKSVRGELATTLPTQIVQMWLDL